MESFNAPVEEKAGNVFVYEVNKDWNIDTGRINGEGAYNDGQEEIIFYRSLNKEPFVKRRWKCGNGRDHWSG